MTPTKNLFLISGLVMLILTSFNQLSAFAQTTAQITINNNLYLNPSQRSPHSIAVCVNGVLEKTITSTGKTTWNTTKGEKFVRLLVNQVGTISCQENASKQFEVLEDRVMLDEGTNTTWDLSGEPVAHGIKSHQSMNVLETTKNPGGNSILVFSPTTDSIFEKVCIDGNIASEARYKEYFVTEGKHTISLPTPHGECDSVFHSKVEIDPSTTTKFQVINSLDYSNACIKGVEVFDDVESIHISKKDEIGLIHEVVAAPAKIQAISTELASAQAATQSLPRTGGVENLLLISSGVGMFGFAAFRNLRRKSFKIDV
jgi:hypothetical protein